jgi:hypothetical protein
MPNPNQRAGREWEESCARLFREGGFPDTERIVVRHPDRGDLGGVPDWTLECKSLGPRHGVPQTLQAALSDYTRAGGIPTPGGAFTAGWKAAQAASPRFDMAAAMDQLAKSRATNGTPYGALLRKRRGFGPERGFMIVELSMGAAIMRRLNEEGTP